MGCTANKVLVEKYVCPNSPSALSIERVAEAKLPTEWGDFTIAGYRSLDQHRRVRRALQR
jgi:hypothetical protein